MRVWGEGESEDEFGVRVRVWGEGESENKW